jgi:16S rRNA (adenine1518-N6/adenine1519-N6)-dimethyltransferase
MIAAVAVTPQTSVLEIGCGDGFLTRSILAQTPCSQLRCFEIDPEWAEVVRAGITDPRLTIVLQNILEVDFEALKSDTPWVVLANLPYQITFPIMFLLQKHKHLFTEGVVMIQEEVAQKIVAAGGRSYNATSVLLQHHFEFKLLEKVEPGAFTPPPKVNSRLLFFKPKSFVPEIPEADNFWKFVKLCFNSPRQTIRNNLKSTHYRNHSGISDAILGLRAQQMKMSDFLEIWDCLLSATKK